MRSDARRGVIGAALAGIAGVYVLSALGLPLGAYNDDALHVLLAQSLRLGHYLRPDGGPETTFLPGMPALLALPAWLVEPHFGRLRLVGICSTLSAALLSWRLLRRALPRAWADVAAPLVALNWVLVDYSGSVMPDIPLLALTLLALLLYERRAKALWAVCATAALLRPEGALLILAIGAALWLEEGAAASLRFALPAAAPLAAWLVRNRLTAGEATHYLSFGRLGAPAGALLGELFGRSLFGGPAVLALLAAPLAFWGAARAWRRRRWTRPAALYLGLYLLVHLLWKGVSEHYLLPILTLVWLFIADGAETLLPPQLALALASLALAGSLARDATLAAAGAKGPVRFQPATMGWIEKSTPRDAKIQSLRYAAVALWAGRRCETPGYFGLSRDAWLADALSKGVSFVHVEPGLAMTGVFPDQAAPMLERLPLWAASSPYLKVVFASKSEGSVVIQVSHPDPRRFLRAYETYQDAGRALARGAPDEARERLAEALALEPNLAYGWAVLALEERSPAKKLAELERAAAADPTDPAIAADLRSLKRL